MLLSGQDAELELSGREEAIPSPMTCPLGPSRPPTPRIAAVDSCTPHAHRNVSDEPAVELVITTARLGRFFQEVARIGVTHPPTPIELAEFVAVATRYGYDLGTPEQNAAIGIALSFRLGESSADPTGIAAAYDWPPD